MTAALARRPGIRRARERRGARAASFSWRGPRRPRAGRSSKQSRRRGDEPSAQHYTQPAIDRRRLSMLPASPPCRRPRPLPRGPRPRATRVETAQVVLPGLTNVHGTIFGGILMQWIDGAAGISAARHAGGLVVTASMDRLHFLRPGASRRRGDRPGAGELRGAELDGGRRAGVRREPAHARAHPGDARLPDLRRRRRSGAPARGPARCIRRPPPISAASGRRGRGGPCACASAAL